VCQDGVQTVRASYQGAHHAARVASRAELPGAARCTESYPLAGFAPCDGRRHPLVVYVPGTIQPHDHGFILEVLHRLARAGFAAVSFDYANLRPGQGCPRYRARSFCMFDAASPESAISRACALPQVDCARGVAVLGHSQGGLIALQAADHDPRVRWVHGMGVTGNPPPGAPDLECVKDAERRLPADRMLIACGDCDVFFDGTPLNDCRARSPGVTRGLIALTGLRCGSLQACIRPGPAGGARHGWIKVPSSRLRDREADHCYMFHQGCFGPPDPDWLENPRLPWALPAVLEDLRRALGPPP
jgi:dienelactone hydrolase